MHVIKCCGMCWTLTELNPHLCLFNTDVMNTFNIAICTIFLFLIYLSFSMSAPNQGKRWLNPLHMPARCCSLNLQSTIAYISKTLILFNICH